MTREEAGAQGQTRRQRFACRFHQAHDFVETRPPGEVWIGHFPHRTALRVLGFAALVLAIVLLAVLVLFALDAVQIRQMAAAGYKRQIVVSSLGAAFAGTMGMIALFLMGRGALVASKMTRLPERRVKTAPSPLVVAGSGAGDAG